MSKQLKVVKLLEPELCLKCRFAEVADVQTVRGNIERMIHCRRGDCDNWDTKRSEPAKELRSVRDPRLDL